ncbi:hypothetical protein T4E_9884 [Trichinella pseudospiralis]|uniref:Uncharacterized protein n=1 Tax=Trichinella pseudospiralis TaxID=6337 RepID=A0A0V0XJ38_TRIPS|nr:hypothetical protein T4E_9884 [Trichinella pseudospiralis]KRY81493.1 hypothetical protein T4D_5102 [Trichinella pseudospiralis]
MACGYDVIERWVFSLSIFYETTSVALYIERYAYILAAVWRYFSENEDRKNYYFYRTCTNECIPGCTLLDDVENQFMSYEAVVIMSSVM